MWNRGHVLYVALQNVPLLFIVLLQFFTLRCETESAPLSVSIFKDSKDLSRFFTYIVNERENTIYVGARQKLFKLTYNLVLLETVIYDDAVFDYVACKSGECKEECDTANNKIKLLLLDQENNLLLTCGTLNYGLCHRHSLSNLSNIRLVDGYSSSANHIVSCRGSSIGLLAPGPTGKNVFYFARTLNNNLLYEQQQSVSTKVWNNEQTGFELIANSTGLPLDHHSFVSVAEEHLSSYKVNYVYGFSYNGFTYFVTSQRRSLSSPKSGIRLVRVCQNDTAYYSYAELSLRCQSKNFPYDALLTKVGKDFLAAYDLHSTGDNFFLFILAADKVRSNQVELCFYDMQVIERSFHDGIFDCNNGVSTDTYLEYIIGSSRYCGTSSSNLPVSVCPTLEHPNYVHHIGIRKPLSGNTCNINLVFNVTGSKIRSFSVFLFNEESTVAVVGSKKGRLSLYHIGANKNQHSKKVVGVKYANQSISQITAVDGGRILFFKDFYTMFQVATSSFCSQLFTCNRCLQHKFIQCGYCAASGRCTGKLDCKESWSDTTCPTTIINFSPTSGPLEGGTIVTFHGEGLGHTTPSTTPSRRFVSFDNYSRCSILGLENYNELVCKTTPIESAKHSILSNISININADQPPDDIDTEPYSIKGQVLLKQQFSFVNVSVESFTPTYGPKSGHTQLLIRGKNLHSGSCINVTVANFQCEVLNRTHSNIVCYTSKFERSATSSLSGLVTVEIDGAKRNATGVYMYKPNPVIRPEQIKFIKRYIIQNQIKIFQYTYCITPKLVTGLQGPSLCHYTWTAQLLLKKCCGSGKPLATLYLIWPMQCWQWLELISPTSETNTLPLD